MITFLCCVNIGFVLFHVCVCVCARSHRSKNKWETKTENSRDEAKRHRSQPEPLNASHTSRYINASDRVRSAQRQNACTKEHFMRMQDIHSARYYSSISLLPCKFQGYSFLLSASLSRVSRAQSASSVCIQNERSHIHWNCISLWKIIEYI